MFTQVYHVGVSMDATRLVLCDFWRCAAIVGQRLYTSPSQP
nr:MAG TPA: hypothetical protein [Caudoviricetes sp.]